MVVAVDARIQYERSLEHPLLLPLLAVVEHRRLAPAQTERAAGGGGGGA